MADDLRQLFRLGFGAFAPVNIDKLNQIGDPPALPGCQ
jgi:hypothetical protein